MLGPAVFLAASCVLKYIPGILCAALHFPRSRGNASGNMLIDLAPLTSTVLPTPGQSLSASVIRPILPEYSPGIFSWNTLWRENGKFKVPHERQGLFFETGAEVGFPHLESDWEKNF